MSNVLIGIIGVILFIGLALAGALFLGPRFQEANNSSKASATVSQISQITHAISLYSVQEGRRMNALDDNQAMLVPRYMKTYPAANPVNGGTYRLNDEYANIYDNPVALVITPMGNSESARQACVAIEKQTGADTPDMSSKPEFRSAVISKGKAVGCILWGGNGNYYAYGRV